MMTNSLFDSCLADMQYKYIAWLSLNSKIILQVWLNSLFEQQIYLRQLGLSKIFLFESLKYVLLSTNTVRFPYLKFLTIFVSK